MGRRGERLPKPGNAISALTTQIAEAARYRSAYVRVSMASWPRELGYKSMATALHDLAVKAACRLAPVGHHDDVARAMNSSVDPELALSSASAQPGWSVTQAHNDGLSDRHDLDTHAALIGNLLGLAYIVAPVWDAHGPDTVLFPHQSRLRLPSGYRGAFQNIFPAEDIPPPVSVRELIELWIEKSNHGYASKLGSNEVSRRRSAARLLVKAANIDLDKSVLQFDTLPDELGERYHTLSEAVGSQWAHADSRTRAADFATIVANLATPPTWFKPLSPTGALTRIKHAKSFYEWMATEWLCLPSLSWQSARA